MSNVINLNAVKIMRSREISGLSVKRHDHVIRDIVHRNIENTLSRLEHDIYKYLDDPVLLRDLLLKFNVGGG